MGELQQARRLLCGMQTTACLGLRSMTMYRVFDMLWPTCPQGGAFSLLGGRTCSVPVRRQGALGVTDTAAPHRSRAWLPRPTPAAADAGGPAQGNSSAQVLPARVGRGHHLRAPLQVSSAPLQQPDRHATERQAAARHPVTMRALRQEPGPALHGPARRSWRGPSRQASP